MEHKKVAFFKRVKNAIIDFDEYKVFADEKVSVAIKYILKLILIFTLVIVAVMTYKFVKQTNEVIDYIEKDFPEFSLQENILVIEGENKKVINGTEDYYLGFIVDSEAENITDIGEANNYQIVVCFLKNKIVVKGIEGVESSITYQQINDVYSINNLDKSKLLEMLSRKRYDKNICYIYSGNVYLSIYNILTSNIIGHTITISSRIFIK